MTQIPGIYVPINADLKQLRSDMGQAKQIITESANSMTNALNGALSGDQAKKGITSLVNNLSTLSQSSKNVGKDFSQLGVDLKQFQGITGTSASQFAKLQSQLLQTQAAKAQEKALRDIARAANLTESEIKALGAQMNVSQTSIGRVTAGMSEFGKSTGFSMARLKDMVVQIGLYTVAFSALNAVVGGVKDEFMRGLSAVEDFDLKVATSAAFIATFSKNLEGADIAGVYDRAAGYAGRLNEKLEMIDAHTIASGKHLQLMSETFIQHGVLLDINNKKQVDGFTNIATALTMVTAGQNQDIQMRQEINALMLGQVRSTDRLANLLTNIDPQLKQHLKTWREEGTVIENIGELLKGFASNTGSLQNQWITVGSTMETIHDRILRDAFRPMFEDLIKLAKALNSSLMDSEGNLTYIAIGIQNTIKGVYEFGKKIKDAASQTNESILNSLPGVGPARAALEIYEKLYDKLTDSQGQSVPVINFGLVDSWKKEAEELARLRNMEDPWMHKALAAPALKPRVDQEEADKAVKKAQKAADDMKRISDDLTKYIKQQTLSEIEYKKWALAEEIKGLRAKAGSNKEIQDQITQYANEKTKEITEFEAEARRKELEVWQETTAGKIEMMNAQVAAQKSTTDTFVKLEELKAEGSKDTLKDIARTTHEELSIMEGEWIGFAHNTEGVFASVIGDGLRGEFNSIGDAWDSLTAGMLNAFISMAANIAAQNLAESIFGDMGGKGDSGGDGWLETGWDWLTEDIDWSDMFGGDSSSDSSWFDGADWFANGGTHKGGLRVVGERGPELEFTGPSTILSNSDSKKYLMSMMGGGMPTVTPDFLALISAMQMAGVTARGVAGEIESLAGAHDDDRSATLDNARATTESTKAEKANTEARSKSTEKSSMTPGSAITGVVGWGLDKFTDALLGPLAPVKDALLAFTDIDEALEKFSTSLIDGALGFDSAVSDTMASLKDAAEGVFGDLGEAGGMLGTAAGDLSGSASALDSAADGAFGTLSDAGFGLSDSASALQSAASGAFGDVSLGAQMTQVSAADLTSSALALTSSAVSLGAAAGSLGSNAGGFLGDPDIDSSDRTDDTTPGGLFGEGHGGSGDGPGGPGPGDGSPGTTGDGGYGTGGDALGFAGGGIHRGGWRMVGERGPELEYTPPSRIFSNADTNSILAGMKSKQPISLTIPVSVGGEPLTTLIVKIADNVATVRQRNNIRGRMVI